MRLFGVISRKATLGNYRNTISDNSNKYYNKCAQYLLVRVGWFMEARKIPPENLDIIFEKANVDYDKMRSFLWTCQNNPKHAATKRLSNIVVSRIQVKKKSEEPILKVADLVAHSLYKAVEKQDKNFGIPEPRYLSELAPHFFGHPKTRAVFGAGLYGVHSIEDLKVDEEVKTVLHSMKASTPS